MLFLPGESQSTVGAGDSMVGAMTLKLAQDASLEEMVRFGVAAGSAATLNQGTRLCSRDDTQKYMPIFPRNNRFPRRGDTGKSVNGRRIRRC